MTTKNKNKNRFISKDLNESRCTAILSSELIHEHRHRMEIDNLYDAGGVKYIHSPELLSVSRLYIFSAHDPADISTQVYRLCVYCVDGKASLAAYLYLLRYARPLYTYVVVLT